MQPEIKLVKNVQILVTPPDHKALMSHLDEPDNAWVGESLVQILETDQNGLITFFNPNRTMTLGLLWHLQYLMLAQRCYLMDEFLKNQGVIK